MCFACHNKNIIGINRDNIVVHCPIGKVKSFIGRSYHLTFLIAKNAATRNGASFHGRHADGNGACKNGCQVAVKVGTKRVIGVSGGHAAVFYPILEAITFIGNSRECYGIAMDKSTPSRSCTAFIVQHRNIDFVLRWFIVRWMHIKHSSLMTIIRNGL